MKLQNTPQPPPPGRGFSLKRVSDPFPGETRLGKMGQSTPGAGSRLLEDTDRPAKPSAYRVIPCSLGLWRPESQSREAGRSGWRRSSLQDAGCSRKWVLHLGPPYRPGGGGCRGSSPASTLNPGGQSSRGRVSAQTPRVQEEQKRVPQGAHRTASHKWLTKAVPGESQGEVHAA